MSNYCAVGSCKGIVAILLVLLFSCTKERNTQSGEAPEPEKPQTNQESNRKALLEHIADSIIVPSYANFRIKMGTMANAANAFTASPSQSTLIEFRNAWTDAYVEWQKVGLFNFGPADTHVMLSFFNIYPARPILLEGKPGIEENLMNQELDLEMPDTYPTQGFAALDYLINGLGTDEEIIAHYATSATAANRIAYLNKLTAKMNRITVDVSDGWVAYRDRFVNNTSTSAGSPLSLLINNYIMYYERNIRSGKIAIPSGAMASTVGSKYPDKVEAFYKKDLSLTLAKTAHQAAIDLFNGKSVKTGKEGPSLKTYLNGLGAKDSKTGNNLSDIINAQFTLANQKLATMGPNLSEQVITDNQKMLDTYEAMQGVIRMLKVDMTSAMSITITYVDTDGD